MREKDHIHSVERAIKILEIFGKSPQPLSLTEVANAANLTKTTTQRFINTLCTLKYLNREENKKYFLGARVLSLGFSYLNGISLATMAKPYIDELSSEVGMTVNLGVLDNTDVLILYRREVKRFLRFDLHPGSKLSAYCSSLGRLLLSGLDDKIVKSRLDSMDIQRLTPKTITSRAAIMEEIYRIRKNGYATMNQELTLDLCSIAVPILNDKNELVAGINVSMHIMQRESSRDVEKAKCKLIEIGESISRHLKYESPYPMIYA